MKKYLLFCFMSSALHGMDYCDDKQVLSSHMQQNKLLCSVLPVPNDSFKSTSQSELSKKMYSTSAPDEALLWSIFAYVVLDDNYIYIPFDIHENIRYNIEKLGSKKNEKWNLLFEKVDYLLRIFYAYKDNDKDKSSDMSAIRKKNKAIELLGILKEELR